MMFTKKQKQNLSNLLNQEVEEQSTQKVKRLLKDTTREYLFAAIGALTLGLLSLKFVPVWMVLPLTACGAVYGYLFGAKKRRVRQQEFIKPYPSMLMAMGASLKVGLAPLQALERSIQTLPTESTLKQEIEKLISDISAGVDKETAIANFAKDYDLPDLELFKNALAIVLDEGGSFAHTLEKLALTANDRAALTEMAKVSTTSMRMTSTILLFATPFIVMTVGARQENFFQTIMEHPTANLLASLGVFIILVSTAALRSMSEFKP